MWLKGRAWVFGDDVDTDQIMPARYLGLTAPQELAAHVMEAIDPEWPARIRPGDIIVGGANFGCGSSREHAPLGLRGAGVACVVARSFARIFYRNSVNIGLPLLTVPDGIGDLAQGAELWVDLSRGIVRDPATGATRNATPVPEIVQRIVSAGGLLPYVRERARARAGASGGAG